MGVTASRQLTGYKAKARRPKKQVLKKHIKALLVHVKVCENTEEVHEQAFNSMEVSYSIASMLEESTETTKDLIKTEGLTVAKRTPIFSLSGDTVEVTEIPVWGVSRLQSEGDSTLGLFSPTYFPSEINYSPLSYVMRLQVMESTFMRLLFLELYGIDMRKMDENQFRAWAMAAGLPRTSRMFHIFQKEAEAYSICHHLTALERRFKITVTLGDCVPMSACETVLDEEDNIKSGNAIREISIYGDTKRGVASALSYLGATLNQFRRGQIVLPDGNIFSITENVDLSQWIIPCDPPSLNSVLLRLRKNTQQANLSII
ncbi:unnamed protein product [Calicophoron daubneyi]|uniref:Uncharacterized protein n=1 Tax=Calicophoron daubneyi TaxID=300641 RepID=A0AAV2TIJ1_CALDB